MLRTRRRRILIKHHELTLHDCLLWGISPQLQLLTVTTSESVVNVKVLHLHPYRSRLLSRKTHPHQVSEQVHLVKETSTRYAISYQLSVPALSFLIPKFVCYISLGISARSSFLNSTSYSSSSPTCFYCSPSTNLSPNSLLKSVCFLLHSTPSPLSSSPSSSIFPPP